MQGAPIMTLDVDAVHARDPNNIEKLIAVLESIDAIFRIQPERKLKPSAASLAGSGHQNLRTRFGSLDMLGTVGKDLGYTDLLPYSEELDLANGLKIRVLKLDKYIELKEELAGEKDLAMLPVLRRTLEEKRKRES